MKYEDCCSDFLVRVSAIEVEAFASRWPCFGSTRALWFRFDKRTGDLVDMSPRISGIDDGGLMALSQDAQAFGQRILNP